jgi:hypothetical protein
MGWTNHEVTHVEMNNLWNVWEASEKLGFFLPEKPSSRLAQITERLT